MSTSGLGDREAVGRADQRGSVCWDTAVRRIGTL